MNRLALMKVYMVGSMDRVADGGVGWRRELTPFLQKLGMLVLDPCNKPIANIPDEFDGRCKINEWKESGDFDKIRPAYGDAIRGIDCRMVDESGVIYCNLDMDTYPCGTHEEWVLANREKKPVIVVCEKGKKNIPNWMFLAMPHQMFFSSHDEAKQYLSYVNSHEGEVETYGRWRFFDWVRLYKETVAVHGEF